MQKRLKNTVLDYTEFTFFIFRVWAGGHGTVATPLHTLVPVAYSP